MKLIFVAIIVIHLFACRTTTDKQTNQQPHDSLSNQNYLENQKHHQEINNLDSIATDHFQTTP